jgi:hypothetical protein
MAHRMYLSSGEVRHKTCVVIEKVQHAVSKSEQDANSVYLLAAQTWHELPIAISRA